MNWNFEGITCHLIAPFTQVKELNELIYTSLCYCAAISDWCLLAVILSGAHAQCAPGKRQNVLVLARKSRAYLAATEAQPEQKQRLERREGNQRPFGWADLDFGRQKRRLIKWPVGIDIYFDCKAFTYLSRLHVVCGRCFRRPLAFATADPGSVYFLK